MYTLKVISLLCLAFVFAGCDSFVDDQSLISEEQYKIVNPTPLARDYELNNSRHKVIIAILDSGVDYNHPALKDNIHFSLDSEGAPIDAGWDFTGNDPWPAPYVARTDFKNPTLTNEARDKSLKEYQAFQKLAEEFPLLANIFSPERQHQEESDEAISHGTHVAGLASYDSPEIGIRGYRILPFNRLKITDGSLAFEKFSTTLLLGIERAIQDGAQVLNMSLGVLSNESMTLEFKKFQDNLIQIVEMNPHVFFVVAAGNEGERLDGKKSLSLPCNIPRKNVICVSALDADLVPTDFSNIVVNGDVTTIYAWGDEILSTVPTYLCSSEKIDTSLLLKDVKAFGDIMMKECLNPPLFQKMSGTSMASPIIARKIAKLIALYPDLEIEEIKAHLFSQTISGTLGNLSIAKLPIEKPSWYKSQGIKPFSLESRMWSFILPN